MTAPTVGIGTVHIREAAFLADPTGGLVKAGPDDTTCPFDEIVADLPTQDRSKRGVYVTVSPVVQWIAYNGLRSFGRCTMRVLVRWPLYDPGGDAQADQAAFAVALDMLTTRIIGTQMDKTHGGQFRSAAAVKMGTGVIVVAVDDPERAIAGGRPLVARISYLIDDSEHNL